ncbi:cytochrome d ubiquinol oxidase subunit II, partial [Thermodesulfobacteriota bacterium]
RAVKMAKGIWPVLTAVAVIFLVASWFATPLYQNYLTRPILFVVIIVTVLALLSVRLFLHQENVFKAWFSSALTIIGATFFGVIGLFPNLFPSSIDPEYSLSAYNASSSPLTLKIMLVVVILFVPLVLAYQIWAYNLFKGKVKQEDFMY